MASVTVTMTPVAPRPQSEALNKSGRSSRSQCTTCVPLARGQTTSRARTYADMAGKWMPEPWEAVEMRPAIVCWLIDPRFEKPKPCFASDAVSVSMYVPANTHTSRLRVSRCTIPCNSSVRTVQPREKGRSEGECRRPTARIGIACRRASSTIATTCSILVGANTWRVT